MISLGMGPGVNAGLVNIPSVFIQRQTAEAIDGALKAGETVKVCFSLPRVKDPYAAYHYATPASQATALKYIGFIFVNRSTGIISDLVIKADIHEPGGNVTSISSPVPPIAPGKDTLVFLPAYTPPANTGEFEVVFSTNKYKESFDTLRRKFVQTDHTWAMDDFVIQTGGTYNGDNLFAWTLKYQAGSLIRTGNDGGIAKYASFGIANIASIYDPSKPDGNQIAVILYDADSDGNGDLNLLGSFEEDLAGDILGQTIYQMTGFEKETTLIDVPILNFDNPTDTGVVLQPNHPYYITVLYNGEANGSGRNCAFTKGFYLPYLLFKSEIQQFILSNPILIGDNFTTWVDRTVITRLHLNGYKPTTNANQPRLLDRTKYSLTPNPANERLRLHLDLEKQNSPVRVAILTGLGRTLRSQSLSDFQGGQIDFDVRDIPSGTYLLWIQTGEGQAIAKVSICH